MATYVKIEAINGGNKSTGVFNILFYDLNGILIPMTAEDIVYHNATARVTDTAINHLFSINSSAPPYLDSPDTLTYIIKIGDEHEGISKLSIKNWVNNTAHASKINISLSSDNVVYKQIETQDVEVNLTYTFLKNFTFFTRRFLLKSNNKIYSLKSEEILHETKMTSNTAPAPFVASASSVYSSTYPAWKAFNGDISDTTNNTNNWLTAVGSKTGWIQLDFGKPTKVNMVKITNIIYNSSTTVLYENHIKEFNIVASNDGINYEKLLNEKVGHWEGSQTKNFAFKNSKTYRYYKLEIVENNGGSYTGVGGIVYSYIENLTQIPSDSVDNFINYGTSSIEHFNLINDHKNYILQGIVSENTDGLWVQEISRKPLSIKFE